MLLLDTTNKKAWLKIGQLFVVQRVLIELTTIQDNVLGEDPFHGGTIYLNIEHGEIKLVCTHSEGSSLLASCFSAGKGYGWYQRTKIIISLTQVLPLWVTITTVLARYGHWCNSRWTYKRNQPFYDWMTISISGSRW